MLLIWLKCNGTKPKALVIGYIILARELCLRLKEAKLSVITLKVQLVRGRDCSLLGTLHLQCSLPPPPPLSPTACQQDKIDGLTLIPLDNLVKSIIQYRPYLGLWDRQAQIRLRSQDFSVHISKRRNTVRNMRIIPVENRLARKLVSWAGQTLQL